ncbi:MAG: helix-turn-helix domain-containing protein [Muribaculaceae bacterium]|nr:helix-turn-helix domain-containing protein [Muribaculaceae bacterium]
MKHVGSLLQRYIEENNFVKKDVAESVGITYNYLSTIFKKDSIDCELLEKFCRALHISPLMFFELDQPSEYNYKSNNTVFSPRGKAELHIDSHNGTNDALLAEKERVIKTQEETINILKQMLVLNQSSQNGTDSGQAH